VTTPIEEGRRKAMLLGLSALLVAGGTSWVAWSVVNRYQSEVDLARQPSGQLELVVASSELVPGQPIRASDLELVEAPNDLARGDATFSSIDEVKGKIPGERILAGELVNRGRLLEGGAVMHADAAIAPGTRALTVKVDRAAGVGGMLRPGFFVDVIVTIRPDTKDLDADWVTETILQGVRVVAVNEWLDGNPEQEEAREQGRARHVDVTLEVDPLEAEKLALASARGELVLSLRHAEDEALLQHEGPLVTNALVGITTARPEKSRRTRRSRVVKDEAKTTSAEVVEGSRTKVEQFDEAGKRVVPAKER
jgi:pilus assembly protein CpaB